MNLEFAKDRIATHFPFLLIIMMTIVFAYPHMEGISPFDPGNYCSCAVSLLRGELNLGNFYCNRIVSYFPVAIAIKLFGFNGFYLTLVTLFELVLLLATIYLALRKYNPEIALITCATIGFAPLMLRLSGTLFGDIMAALTANICILWIWHIRFISVKPKQAAAGALLAVMWYAALLAKESALYYLIPMLIVFIMDMRKKQFMAFWNSAIIAGVAIGVLFLSAYFLKTGNLFHRLELLEVVPNSQRNYADVSRLMILTRVTVLPVKFLIENFSFYLLFLPGVMQLFSKSENEKETFFKIYMVSLTVLWWAGTQSFSSWKPLLLEDRVWLPLLVPFAINAAHVFYSIPRGSAKRYATGKTKIIIACFAAAIVIAGYISGDKMWNAANPLENTLSRLALLFFLHLSIFYGQKIAQGIDLAANGIGHLADLLKKGAQYLLGQVKPRYAVVLLLLLPVIFHVRYVKWKNPHDNNYLSEQEMINTVIETGQPATIICERSVCGNHGIYFGFDPAVERQVQFVDWNTTSAPQLEELAGKGQLFMLVTKDRMLWYKHEAYLSMEMKLFIPLNYNLPSFVESPELHWELARQDSRTVLYSYKPQR